MLGLMTVHISVGCESKVAKMPDFVTIFRPEGWEPNIRHPDWRISLTDQSMRPGYHRYTNDFESKILSQLA